MTFSIDRRILAVVGAVGVAALVAGAEALRQALAAGQIAIDPVLATVLAAALGGGLAAYARSERASP